nr:hypothetical protein [Tanacetum cinerariifolium]
MSNIGNNMQTQTSNTLHNAIMEAGSKDRPPMLAPGWREKVVLDSEGNPTTSTERVFETYKNVKQDIRDQLNAEAKAVQIILTGIDNDIYSTVDACPNACEMWKAIERLKQVDSYVDDIVSLRSANRVTKETLQRFNMPTHTIPMLSKKPRRATADLHQDILGIRNPGLGYLAKRTQPVLYDGNTLLDPTLTPVSVWDSDDVVSLEKSNKECHRS